MPAPILTQAATIMCPHGGQAIVVPQNMLVQIANSPVLVMTDVFIIVGCVFMMGPVPAPCLSIMWTMPAISVLANHIPVLLQTSIGLCMGVGPPLPAIVIPGQFTVMGT